MIITTTLPFPRTEHAAAVRTMRRAAHLTDDPDLERIADQLDDVPRNRAATHPPPRPNTPTNPTGAATQ